MGLLASTTNHVGRSTGFICEPIHRTPASSRRFLRCRYRCCSTVPSADKRDTGLEGERGGVKNMTSKQYHHNNIYEYIIQRIATSMHVLENYIAKVLMKTLNVGNNIHFAEFT